MFTNIGKKIQLVAKIGCWLGIVASVLCGLALALGGGAMFSDYGYAASGSAVVTGLLTAVIGALASWIGSFFTIGFGKLVENCEEIAANTRKAN